jgi:hypothetical protein
MDADGDGLLTPAEHGPHGMGADARFGRMFARADADGDGALDRAEWDAFPPRR